MRKTLTGWLLAAVALGPPALGQVGNTAPPSPSTSIAEELVASLASPTLRALGAEVVGRNPELARLRREAEMAAARAPQVSSLPDPMAAVTAFLLTPETRTGPQRLQASLSQRFPWAGKLAAAEREALWTAAAARARLEARALELVTETRRAAWELAYLAAEEETIEADRYTLERFEQLARARYAAGAGTGQPVVKIQAEITRADQRLLDLEARRAALTAALNALRDRRADAPVTAPELPTAPDPRLASPGAAAGADPSPGPSQPDPGLGGSAAAATPAPSSPPASRGGASEPERQPTERQPRSRLETEGTPPAAPMSDRGMRLEVLRRLAAERRPELARERARIAAAEAAGERAELERRPDLTVGLGYTLVDRRDDAAGRAMPPEGNGDDIVGVTLGLNLPVRTARIDAGIAEAEARRGAAEEALRSADAAIERDLGDLAERVRLTGEQTDLFDRVLVLQAEESLRSAESAYTAGTLRALDLLDAERILFQVRLAAARARTDHLIARARLEGAAGRSLDTEGATP